jgi:hypothetical protein
VVLSLVEREKGASANPLPMAYTLPYISIL